MLGAYPIYGIGVHGPGGKLVFLERRRNAVTRMMIRNRTRVVASILETSPGIVFHIILYTNIVVNNVLIRFVLHEAEVRMYKSPSQGQ